MLKKALIPLSLLAVAVALSGCPEVFVPTGMVSTNGIIIKDFSFDYSPIYTGESIGLTLTLQNVGGEIGTLKEIDVFGVDAPSSTAGNLTWGYGTSAFNLTINQELLPPDTSTGFEGEEYFQEWIPESPQGIRAPTDYDFQVRAKYLYSTTFTGKIMVVDNDYLRSLPSDEREALVKVGGVQDASVTGGPLSLTAATGSHFIVRSGDTEQTRSIKFKINNVGSGFPYAMEGYSVQALHYVNVTDYQGDITCTLGGVKLSRGKTGVISCDFTAPAHGSFTNKIDKMFTVKLDYGYYVDSATSITVNPIFY